MAVRTTYLSKDGNYTQGYTQNIRWNDYRLHFGRRFKPISDIKIKEIVVPVIGTIYSENAIVISLYEIVGTKLIYRSSPITHGMVTTKTDVKAVILPNISLSSSKEYMVTVAVIEGGYTFTGDYLTSDRNNYRQLNEVWSYDTTPYTDNANVMPLLDYSSNTAQMIGLTYDYDTPPTTPSSISASGTFQTGQQVTVSWGASTDADGDAITYKLGVSRNGMVTQIISSTLTGRSYTYTIPSGTTSLRFEVQAQANGKSSSYRYSPTYTVSDNAIPSLTVATTDNRTLYENDQYTVSGQVTDTDVGNVVTVKYSIDGGTERAIIANISQGSAIVYNKVLTFKQGKLFDGANAITDVLTEGAQHVLRVWAEDDKGGKSAEQIRVFYVVANRSAVLTINPFTVKSDLIDSDTITISGEVSDPDGNNVVVKYKIGNGSFTEVYNGTGGAFSFNVTLADLQSGVNTITVQATDSYGLTTPKTLRVTKSTNNKPLLTSVATYKLTPPNGSADGIVLWVQRETGDLVVDAEISMSANGEPENFQPMTKAVTAYVSDTIEEDEFTFDNGGVAAENIILRLTMTRTSATSDKGIKLISGVLS